MRSENHKQSLKPAERSFRLVAEGQTMSETMLLPKGRWTLGRSSDCDLVVKHASISRKHATLDVLDTAVSVTDLNSRNGTFVNEIRVRTQSTLLPEGHIRFGEALFVLLTKPYEDWALDSAEETDHRGVNPASTAVLSTISNDHGNSLSPAQHRILTLALDGLAEKRIASRLGLSTHTVHNHVRAIYRAFQVHSRPELFARLLSYAKNVRSASRDSIA
jgi:pSer/pThr/pTyr-binding forkhead associated (FHA) protein